MLHKATDSGGQPTLRATLLPKPGGQHSDPAAAAEQAEDSPQAAQQQGDEVDMRHVQAMLQQAQACWVRRGHPGWALLQMDTPAFQLACSHHQQASNCYRQRCRCTVGRRLKCVCCAGFKAALILTPERGGALFETAEPMT